MPGNSSGRLKAARHTHAPSFCSEWIRSIPNNPITFTQFFVPPHLPETEGVLRSHLRLKSSNSSRYERRSHTKHTQMRVSHQVILGIRGTATQIRLSSHVLVVQRVAGITHTKAHTLQPETRKQTASAEHTRFNPKPESKRQAPSTHASIRNPKANGHRAHAPTPNCPNVQIRASAPCEILMRYE